MSGNFSGTNALPGMDYPYVLRGTTVNTGATVTVSAGTVFKVSTGASLINNGTLNIDGTAQSPVVFASLKDDSISGDTNGDGPATSSAPGDWGQVKLNQGRATYVDVRHAGQYGYAALENTSGSSTISHAQVGSRAGPGVRLAAGGSLTDSTVTYAASSAVVVAGGTVSVERNTLSGSKGVYIDGGDPTVSGNTISGSPDGVYLDVNGTTATVDGNTITGATSHGVYAFVYNRTLSGFTVTNNTIDGSNHSVRIRLSAGGLGSILLQGNTVSGTAYRGYSVDGTVQYATALYPMDKPYVISSLVINAGATLTVNPGAILKMTDMNAGVGVSGVLDVRGSAAKPVVLTALADDAQGGDTNGDGGATSPQRGAWSRVYPYSGGCITLDYARLFYGGYSGGAVNLNAVAGAAVTVSNSEVTESGQYALHVSESATSTVTVTGSNLHHNGTGAIYAYGNADAATITVAGTEITDQTYGIRGLNHAPVSVTESRLLRNSYGVYYDGCTTCTGVKTPSVKRSDIVGNGTGVRNLATEATLHMQDNWWGHASGPAPKGTGDSISGPVYFEIYVGQQYEKARQYGSAWWGMRKGPVQLPTGDYSHAVTDLSVSGGKGPAVQIGRTYHSTNRAIGSLGIGWSFVYDFGLSDQGTVVTATYGSGQQAEFTRQADGTYTAPSGDTNRLVKLADGTYELTSKGRTLYRYDAAGKPTAIVDRNGNTVSLGYGTDQRVGSVTDAAGRTFTFTRDASGRIKQAKDPLGQTVTYSYDGKGRLVSVLGLLGGLTEYGYDESDRLTTITAPTEPVSTVVLTVAYDGNSRVDTVTDGEGNVTKYTYDPLARTSTVTDPLGAKTTTTWDANLRVLSITDTFNKTTTRSYDSFNNIRSVQDKMGGITTYTYDSRQNLLSESDPLGNTTSYEYDTDDNLKLVRDPRQFATVMTHDSKGNMLTSKDPLLKVTTYNYNVAGQLLTVKDPLNHTTTYTYYANGNLESVKDATGRTMTFTYDLLGRQETATDALNQTVTYRYNPAGQLTETLDPDNAMMERRAYDKLGRLKSVTDGAGGITVNEYDKAGRLVKVTDPRQKATTFGYDAAGNRRSVTDPMSQKTDYEYDLLGRLKKVTSFGGTIYEYGYDALGRLTSIKDGRLNTRMMTYDAAGRLTTEKLPATLATEYQYDRSGNRTSMTDPAGGVTTYTYDELGRLTALAAPGGLTVTYGFDDAGRMERMTDSTGTTVMAYDDANRLIRRTLPGGRFLEYFYDEVGNLKNTTDYAGQVVTRTYDKRNRLWKVTPAGETATTITYDGANRWRTQTYPSGIIAEATRDAAGLVTKLQNRRPDNSVISSFDYTHDDLGRITGVVDAVGTTSYTYDKDGRLETVTEPVGRLTTYGYDGAGNRRTQVVASGGTTETTTYGYDANDRLSSVTLPSGGVVNYAHDLNGNMTSDGARTFAYDGLNRLVEVQQGGATQATYSYDGTGLRVAKTTASGTVRYYYDGGVILNEGDGTGAITTTNLWGLGLLRRTQAGQSGYYLYNGRGDVVSVLDQSGAEIGAYRYGAFGELSSSSGTADNPFRYSAEPYDEETGFIYLRARYYSPSIGRFMTQDSWKGDPWQPWTQNLYVYVGNNPVNYVDPTGHFPAALVYAAWVAFGWLALNGPDVIETAVDVWDYSTTKSPEGAVAIGKDLLAVLSPAPAIMDGPTSAILKKADVTVPVSKKRFGEAAGHMADAQAAGHPSVLTINRPGADANRAESLRGYDKVPGKQLDEYPPAMFAEGGAGASVRPISPHDNMSLGSYLGNRLRRYPDRTIVELVITEE